MNGMAEIVDSAAVEQEVIHTPAPFVRQEKRELVLAEV